MQTNDFTVGAMGKRYNRNEDRYAKLLKTHIVCKHIRLNKTMEPEFIGGLQDKG